VQTEDIDAAPTRQAAELQVKPGELADALMTYQPKRPEID